MSSIEHHRTALYVFIDDFLTAHPTLAHWRQFPHNQPAFADAEVLTIALLQGCLGVARLKQTYRLVAHNGRSAFPCLCLRHGRVRWRREDGADGGKTSQGWFCGFQLHVLRPLEGRIVNLVLTPGNWDDRAPVLTLLDGVDGGVTLGDLGDRGQQRAEKWAEEAEMLVLTRADAPEQKFLLAQGRQAIEASFSQLWYQFVDRIFSRSWRGLWNTIQFKVLHYNLRHAGVLSL